MGRTEPSLGLPPPSFRRDARAKKAKATLHKVIPSLLSSHPRSRRGVEASELIVNPPRKPHPSSPELITAPRLTLQVADTLTAAHALLRDESTGEFDLANQGARVGILSMASPLSPGGGFLNGASSQEESLCMRTTLFASLKDDFYRLPELGAVYTPDVLVFRDEQGDDLEKRDRWFVDCVSAAMLRFPDTEVDESGRGSYVDAKDRDLAVQKMRTVMRVFRDKGVKRVVLGAWGCGAYGNPLGEISKAWRTTLLGGKEGKNKNNNKNNREVFEGIEEVVFAIKDPGLADGFAEAFGEGLVREECDCEEEDDESEEGNQDMSELESKMKELELRIQQSVNPQVKAGLESILQALKAQGSATSENAET